MGVRIEKPAPGVFLVHCTACHGKWSYNTKEEAAIAFGETHEANCPETKLQEKVDAVRFDAAGDALLQLSQRLKDRD